MAIVYRHRRLDTNEVFYVGIGSRKDRPHSKHNRNKYWYRITNKTKYIVEILYNNILIEDAKELEIFLISLYGRKDLKKGSLCNMTDGGDGFQNLSKESKQKIGKATSKRNNKPENKAKLIERNKNRIWTKESINKMIKTKKNNGYVTKHSKETKLKIGKSKSKKVIDIVTKEIYESARICAEQNNILPKTLVNKLSGHRFNNTNFEYLINYSNEQI